jgi:hypothetical protein
VWPIYHASMVGGGGESGGILPRKMFEMSFPAFPASKFAPKFMLTILVFVINKGKNARKVKKINHHLSLLIRGG